MRGRLRRAAALVQYDSRRERRRRCRVCLEAAARRVVVAGGRARPWRPLQQPRLCRPGSPASVPQRSSRSLRARCLGASATWSGSCSSTTTSAACTRTGPTPRVTSSSERGPPSRPSTRRSPQSLRQVGRPRRRRSHVSHGRRRTGVAVGQNGVPRRRVRLLLQRARMYRLDHRLRHRNPRRAAPAERHLTAVTGGRGTECVPNMRLRHAASCENRRTRGHCACAREIAIRRCCASSYTAQRRNRGLKCESHRLGAVREW